MQGSKMSLQEFQQATAGSGTATSSRAPAWGKGSSAGSAAAADCAPTAADRASVWGKGKSRSSDALEAAGGSRSAALPRSQTQQATPTRTAWERGLPPSALDALWSQAPAVAEAPPGAWDAPAPAEEVEDWGEALEAEADAWAQPTQAADWDHHEERVVPVAVAKLEAPTATIAEEPDLREELAAWLAELGFAEHQEAVLQWCSEMGAATIEEVVDSLDDLVDALPFAHDPVQRNRLVAHGEEVWRGLRAKSRRGGADGVLSSVPSTEASSHTGAGEGAIGAVACRPAAGSYYSRQEPASLAGEPRQGRWRGGHDADGASGGGGDEPVVIQSFYEKQGLPPSAADDENFIQGEYSRTATWSPKQKVTQSELKRQQRQLRPARSATTGSAPDAEDSVAAAQAEATRLLQEQLAEKLRQAAELGDRATFDEVAREADGLMVQLACLDDLRDDLSRTVERLEASIAMVLAALRQPMDRLFADRVRGALSAADEARHFAGHAVAKAQADDALQACDALQMRRDTVRMELHMHLQRQSSPDMLLALRASLAKAEELDLGGAGGDGELVGEAAQRLEELELRLQADQAASERLQRAILDEDLSELPLAIDACRLRRLPVAGAEELLQRLQAEEQRREAAALALRRAIDAEDVAAARTALAEARAAGVEAWLLSKAEDFVAASGVAAKRRDNASVELSLARNAKDAVRLRHAVEEAEAVGVSRADVSAAKAELAELESALAELQRCVGGRGLSPLRRALAEAEVLLVPHGSSEHAVAMSPVVRELLRHAKALARELEEAARREAEERRRDAAADALREALRQRRSVPISEARRHALHVGMEEGSKLLREAALAMEELREEHELEEAECIVRETNAKLEELRAQDQALAGAVHKKERSAIGKRIMTLKGSEEFISAQRFLKDPEAERQRRLANARELERQAEEQRARRLRREEDASRELQAAIEALDEDAVRALLVEDVLVAAGLEAAEFFLAEREVKRREAEKDAALCEFSFAGMDRRSFFQASIAVNELLTAQYSLQEGFDFKLKVVQASNSVFVAFRCEKMAAEIRSGAVEAAQRAAGGGAREAAMVAQAKIRGPGNFADVSATILQGLRQDAENLRTKERSDNGLLSTRAHSQVSVSSTGASAGIARAQSVLSTSSEAAGASAAGSLPVGEAGAQPPVRAHTVFAGGSSGTYGGKGNGGSKGGMGKGTAGGPGRGPRVPPGAAAGGPGRCSGGPVPAAGRASAQEPSVLLPLSAAAILQRNADAARSFHDDLRQFARMHRVRADLRGLDAVVVRPGLPLSQELLDAALDELRQIVAHNFPQAMAPPVVHLRQVRLRVHPESGAGLELTAVAAGFRVDHIEPYPGQDLQVGDVIAAIEGRSLAGLDQESMEDAFGERFSDGALLTLVPS